MARVQVKKVRSKILKSITLQKKFFDTTYVKEDLNKKLMKFECLKLAPFKNSKQSPDRCTDVRFASFLSGGFTTMAAINPPEKKLAKRTSVRWVDSPSHPTLDFLGLRSCRIVTVCVRDHLNLRYHFTKVSGFVVLVT